MVDGLVCLYTATIMLFLKGLPIDVSRCRGMSISSLRANIRLNDVKFATLPFNLELRICTPFYLDSMQLHLQVDQVHLHCM